MGIVQPRHDFVSLADVFSGLSLVWLSQQVIVAQNVGRLKELLVLEVVLEKAQRFASERNNLY